MYPWQPKSEHLGSSNSTQKIFGYADRVAAEVPVRRASRCPSDAAGRSVDRSQDRLPHRFRLRLDRAEHGAQAGPQIVHLVE